MNYKEKPRCSYCKKEKIDSILKSESFQYFRCRHCGLVFLFPQPDKTYASFLNKKMYGESNKIDEYLRREKYYRQISKKIIEKIKQYQTSGKFLDVGCFCGLFLDEARKAGFKVYGLEIEKKAADYGRKKLNLNIINKDFEKYKNGQFDVITFIDVLEHLPDLRKVLLKVKKMLNKNGILFIQCPNIESFVFRLTREKWNWLLPGNHLYQFSTKSLKKILQENGFNVLSAKTYDDISEFAYNLIDMMGIKKRNLGEKIIWRCLRTVFLIILQLSFVWSYFGYGGVINIMAKKNT